MTISCIYNTIDYIKVIFVEILLDCKDTAY